MTPDLNQIKFPSVLCWQNEYNLSRMRIKWKGDHDHILTAPTRHKQFLGENKFDKLHRENLYIKVISVNIKHDRKMLQFSKWDKFLL